jgi:iron complex outermembrane receptor protein
MPSQWMLSASVAKAYRFATAAELYQLVTTGSTFTSPDPNLQPDNVLASELRAERSFGWGKAQLALFSDNTHDAIISQFKPLVPGSNTYYSYISNVEHVRSRGVELVFSENDVLVSGLQVTGSGTWLNARTLEMSGKASATASPDAEIGKQLPNIPEWRGTVEATYRPVSRLSLTAAGRYSSAVWTTLDNTDVNPNVYQGFSAWFVADARANYRFNRHFNAALGVDNVLNRKYFLFHPFPQRTFSTSLSASF